jgi:hypothetical protein
VMVEANRIVPSGTWFSASEDGVGSSRS